MSYIMRNLRFEEGDRSHNLAETSEIPVIQQTTPQNPAKRLKTTQLLLFVHFSLPSYLLLLVSFRSLIQQIQCFFLILLVYFLFFHTVILVFQLVHLLQHL